MLSKNTIILSLLIFGFSCANAQSRKMNKADADLSPICLPGYHKKLASSVHEVIDDFYLLADQKQLVVTSRLGEDDQFFSALRLYNASENFVKGLSLNIQGKPTSNRIIKLSEHRLLGYINSNDQITASKTLVLINDDLEIVWSTTLVTDSEYFSDVVTQTDAILDSEGNVYISAHTTGVLGNPPTMSLLKLGVSGNIVWEKKIALDKGKLSLTTLVETPLGICVIAAGLEDGSASAVFDKASGDVLYSHHFNTLAEGSMHLRYGYYYNNQIVYIGSDENNNLMLLKFNADGAPTTMKRIENSSIPRGADFFENKVYISYYDDTNEYLLKMDTNFTLDYVKAYSIDNRVIRGLQTDGNNTYLVGFNIATPVSTFKTRNDEAGNRGSCRATEFTPKITEVSMNVGQVSYSYLQTNTTQYTIAISPTNFNDPLLEQEVLCVEECTYVRTTGDNEVCDLSKSYSYSITTSGSCAGKPIAIVDTSYAKVIDITDSTLTVQFLKVGETKIHIILSESCKELRDSLTININTCSGEGLYFPGAFSPNGDGLNDFFRALTKEKIVSFKLEVFNRYGNVMFRTESVNHGWDGTYRGKAQATDDFVWQCVYQIQGRQVEVQKGVVTLVR